MPLIQLPPPFAVKYRLALSTSQSVATILSPSLSRALHCSAHPSNHGRQEGQQEESVEDSELDPNSLQARMIRAVQEKYSPPSPTPPRSSLSRLTPSRLPRESPPTTTAQAEEAVSQVFVVPVAHAAVATDAHPLQKSNHASSSSTGAAEEPLTPVGAYEDGRFLPRTPNGQPWAAKYIRPSHAGNRGGEGGEGSGTPAVYYGKLLQAGAAGSSMKSTSQRLKDLGVNPSSLPLDDAKAMRAVREGIRRFERAGRVYGAKYGAMEYKTRKLTSKEIEQLQAEIEAESLRSRERRGTSEDDNEGDDFDSFSTTMSRNLPDSVDSSRAPGGGASGGRGGGMSVRRWTSIADERIEAARAAGFFKENKLRGRPLQQDIEERNPYIGKEEFLMNRMVKRQGASPPWVELNNTFHNHLDQFRNKIVDSYSRKAVRILTQSGVLSSSGGPGTGSHGTDEQRRTYFLSLAKAYRDGGDWQSTERGYHEASIKDMNDTLKRHNFVCPPSARRGMLTRDEELQRCYRDSVEVIARGLQETWEEVTGRKERKGSSVFDAFGKGHRGVSFDIWGNPVEAGQTTGAKKGWGLDSLFSKSHTQGQALDRPGGGGGGGGGGGEGDDGIVDRSSSAEAHRSRRGIDGDMPYLGERLIKKIKTWFISAARQSTEMESRR